MGARFDALVFLVVVIILVLVFVFAVGLFVETDRGLNREVSEQGFAIAVQVVEGFGFRPEQSDWMLKCLRFSVGREAAGHCRSGVRTGQFALLASSRGAAG